MMETAIYARVSTEEQVKEGYSIRGQEQKLKDYALVKDWSIYDVYIDEGISGKNLTARPEINRLINDVKKGNVKNVLVFKIDRLTRSTSDLIFLVDLFNQHDCAFNSLMESIDTQTASGRMFLKIIGTFAEFERENIAERIILGRERKVNEGYTLCSYVASYGYERPNGQKIQTIIESEAQIVREIFDLFANHGVTMTEIARRLNLRGIPTKQGVKWNVGGVKNILKNSNYIGNVRHHYLNEERSYTVQGKHEAIISEELFNKASHRLVKTKRMVTRKPPKDENYFSGFLVCAKCGHKFIPHNIYKKLMDGTTNFLGNYECDNQTVGECNASSMSAKKLEKSFCEYIKGIAEFDADSTFQIRAQETKKQEAQALIAEYEEKLRHLEAKGREALDFYVSNTFTVGEYRAVKQRLDKDKQTVCAELERLYVEAEEVVENKLEFAKSIHENWETFSNSDKRQFLMQFVEKIVVENQEQGRNRKGHMQRKVVIHDIVFREG